MAEQDFLSIQDVARRMGVHQKTVRAYIESGQLKAKKMGRLYRISIKDYEAFTGAEMSADPGYAAEVKVQPERTSGIDWDTIEPRSRRPRPSKRAELRRIRSELDRFLDELDDVLVLEERRTG